mmetsp:Transcript_24831/g.59721  ORF Transcript_24831/g.59721 Transcript_24831/m.59721 type:complete len:83 (-) Transcript_24831:644-892(-)
MEGTEEGEVVVVDEEVIAAAMVVEEDITTIERVADIVPVSKPTSEKLGNYLLAVYILILPRDNSRSTSLSLAMLRRRFLKLT